MCRSQGAEISTWVGLKKIADEIGIWWYIAEIRWENVHLILGNVEVLSLDLFIFYRFQQKLVCGFRNQTIIIFHHDFAAVDLGC